MGARAGTDAHRWPARPGVARSVRLTYLLVPLLTSVATAAGLARLIPHSSLGLLWWPAVLGGSTTALVLADRVTRRLMPLAALLEMSVLFPGPAPSRLAVARDAGNPRRLRELARGDAATDEESLAAARRVLVMVGWLRTHDARTRGHSERVRLYTDLIGAEMGLSEQDRDKLRWAALLHDIGKLEVPAQLLNKPGKPTSSEWLVIRRHPEAGARIAAPLLPWLGRWADTIGQHHERWDGTGYPRGLAGDQIGLGARIVSVADTFDVITSARSYRPAMSRGDALRELVRCSGTQFDPAVVRTMLAVSAPRLNAVIGPLSWLCSLPVLGHPVQALPTLGAMAPAAASSAGMAAVSGTIVFAALPATLPADPPPPAAGTRQDIRQEQRLSPAAQNGSGSLEQVSVNPATPAATPAPGPTSLPQLPVTDIQADAGATPDVITPTASAQEQAQAAADGGGAPRGGPAQPSKTPKPVDPGNGSNPGQGRPTDPGHPGNGGGPTDPGSGSPGTGNPGNGGAPSNPGHPGSPKKG